LRGLRTQKRGAVKKCETKHELLWKWSRGRGMIQLSEKKKTTQKHVEKGREKAKEGKWKNGAGHLERHGRPRPALLLET